MINLTRLGINYIDGYVYAAIKKDMGNKTELAIMPLCKIANRTGLSIEEIQKSIDMLQKADFLSYKIDERGLDEYIFDFKDKKYLQVHYAYRIFRLKNLSPYARALFCCYNYYCDGSHEFTAFTINKANVASGLGMSIYTLNKLLEELKTVEDLDLTLLERDNIDPFWVITEKVMKAKGFSAGELFQEHYMYSGYVNYLERAYKNRMYEYETEYKEK